MSCAEYFAHMVTLGDQLAAAGAPIIDSDLVSYILSGLGVDYNSFIVTLTTRSDPVSLADLHGYLLSHENLLSAQLQSTDPVALYSSHSSRGRGRGSRGRGRGNGSGYHSSNSGPATRGAAPQQGLLPTPQQAFSSTGRGGPSHSQYRGAVQQSNSGRGAANSSQSSLDLPTCQVAARGDMRH